MLIFCKECGRQISSLAISCPGCGRPNKPPAKTAKRHMKLPNGFGSITKVTDRPLRNPYYVRTCVGKTEAGRPILRSIKPKAYFKTYNDAYAALVEYNKRAKDLVDDLTVKEIYEKFQARESRKDLSKSTLSATRRSFDRSAALHDKYMADIRPRHLRMILEDSDIKPYEQAVFKTFWCKLFDFAIEYEYATHNYARDFKLDFEITRELAKTKREHVPFSDEELERLWKNARNSRVIKWILIQCYMGWRPGELCSITLEDVDLSNRYIRGGSKTEAGINRIVPIHTAVFPLVKTLYDESAKEGQTHLLTFNGKSLKYYEYKNLFDEVIEDLDLSEEHRPHDPRKTFVTLAKKAGVDEYALKRLVGHSVEDITENIYTSRDIEWLREDLEKIKVSKQCSE